jgi:hypothetical protein
VFAVNAVSFLGVLIAVFLLPGSGTVAGQVVGKLGGSIREAVTYVFAQRSIASLLLLTALAGVFGTPPDRVHAARARAGPTPRGAGTLGALTASIGLGSLLGSGLLLLLARRANKGEPVLTSFLLTALAVAAVGASHSIELSIALGVLGGFSGVIFVRLSTVVVQSAASGAMRARVSAIWAACFVGLLPLGGLITAALTAELGPGGAVLIDGLAMLVGGAAVIARRPEVAWLGCAALPRRASPPPTQPHSVAFQAAPRRPPVNAGTRA